jgi:hypothetical protein
LQDNLHTNDGITDGRLLARDPMDAAQIVELLAIQAIDVIQREVGGPARKAKGQPLGILEDCGVLQVEINARMPPELTRINRYFSGIFRLFFGI